VHPAHFAERYGLIVIIAVGESLGAIGFGAHGTHLAPAVIAGAVLGFLVAASFCFAYFDFAAGGIQRLLEERRGAERVALARDAYTYCHLPMITGIVLFAFAMRTALAHIHSELRLIPALALCCGGALYLLGFVAVRLRVSQTRSRSPGRGPLPHADHAARGVRFGASHARARHRSLVRFARVRADLVERERARRRSERAVEQGLGIGASQMN